MQKSAEKCTKIFPKNNNAADRRKGGAAVETRDFFENGSQAAALALARLAQDGRAFVRMDLQGRIIDLTPQAAHILGLPPLRCVWEVLSAGTVQALRSAIAQGSPVCLPEEIDGVRYQLALQPGAQECLLGLAAETPQPYLLEFLADARLRSALSAAALCEGAAKQRAIQQIYRMLDQIELLRGDGRLPRPIRVQRLGDLCRRVARMAALRRPALEIRAVGGPTPAAFQAEEMEIAAYQLMTNAIQAEGVTCIEIGSGRVGGQAYLEVADNGAPLAQDAWERLCSGCWERVAQWDPLQSRPYPGLGLPAVCAVAQRHRGTLTLEQRPDGWKALRLSFPADLPAELPQLRAPTQFHAGYDRAEIEFSVLESI